MATIYTIGHSTHTEEEFLDLLKQHGTELLADVRSYPGSRHVPQFNRENMEQWLPEQGIGYLHLKDLGGRKRKIEGIDEKLVNGWRNESFRNYAAYSLTETYEKAIEDLILRAKEKVLCCMCAEAVPWRCHRLIISNTLSLKGVEVLHIISDREVIRHRLGMYGANPVVDQNKITYPFTSE